MAELWTLSNAIASLRRRLSDGAADKYRHYTDTDPEANGIHVDFAVPDSLLVTGTLQVYVASALTVPSASNLEKGVFTLGSAPPLETVIQASYYFQWFRDAELQEFLTQAVRLLNYDAVDDATIPVPLRTPMISFAAHYAYLKKAGEAAPAIVTAAAGFSADNSEEHPNWLALAKLAWETATQELETINEITPISVVRPAMKFTAFRLARFVPRS